MRRSRFQTDSSSYTLVKDVKCLTGQRGLVWHGWEFWAGRVLEEASKCQVCDCQVENTGGWGNELDLKCIVKHIYKIRGTCWKFLIPFKMLTHNCLFALLIILTMAFPEGRQLLNYIPRQSFIVKYMNGFIKWKNLFKKITVMTFRSKNRNSILIICQIDFTVTKTT